MASLRNSWVERSLSRAANVAACVRRSIAQLGEQVRDVVLHRLLGQVHRVRDLAVGGALGNEVEDPAFLGREAGEARIDFGPSRSRSSTRSVKEGSSSDSPAPTRRMV